MVAQATDDAPRSWHTHDFAGGTKASRREPCPVCKHTDWCETCSCGAVHCMRTASGSPYPARGGGYIHNEPPRTHQGPGDRVRWSTEDFAAKPPPAPEPDPVVDRETRHVANSALLALCPLSSAHEAHLMGRRGLPREALADYGTLPDGMAQTPIVAALVRQFGREVQQIIAGLATDQSRALGLRLNGAGLLIPVRNVSGQIVSFQVRADRGQTRYRWLSSSDGPSSGSPAHVARPKAVTNPCIFITEGALKANIAAQHTGAVVVGMAGIGTWRSVLPTMESLQREEGATVAVIALDADDPQTKAATVQAVTATEQELAAALVTMGYAVRFARWDHSMGKGLDDLLLAGNDYALEVYHPTLAAGETFGAAAPAEDDGVPLADDPTSTARKLRVLTQLIRNPAKRRAKDPTIPGDRAKKPLTPQDVAVLLACYVRADAWPVCRADQAPPDDVPMRPLPVSFIAAAAGITPAAAGRSLKHLASLKLLKVEQRWAPNPDPACDNLITITSIGPGRELGWNEPLPESEHRASERTRVGKYRCPSCHGTRMVPKTLVCLDCASIVTGAEAEKAEADYERAAYERAAPPPETDPEPESCITQIQPTSASSLPVSDDAGPPVWPDVLPTERACDEPEPADDTGFAYYANSLPFSRGDAYYANPGTEPPARRARTDSAPSASPTRLDVFEVWEAAQRARHDEIGARIEARKATS